MTILSHVSPRAALLLLLAAAPVLAAPPAKPDPLADALRADITFLSSDAMEGRGLGQRGHEIAANYVAAEFTRLGLKPAGTDGFFQRVNFAESKFTSDKETAALDRDGKVTVWTNGVELSLNPGTTSGSDTITAPLVFAGFGLKDAKLGIDDFAGLDVRGKFVVVLSGYYPGMNSEIGAHLARTSKASTALANGAVGLIQVRTLQEAARLPWEKSVSRARTSRRTLLGPDGQPLGDGAGLAVRAGLDDAAAATVFAGAPMDFAAVRAAAAKGPVKGFALPGSITIKRAQEVTKISSPNVLAMLPGSSATVGEQIVLISAHLDHIGLKADAKPGTDNVYNGAMDNASGTAMLLAAARALATSKTPPKRSVLFLSTTAEESGLLGADYFARVPTVPMYRVVGAVNIDMPILTCDFGDIVAFGADRSTMARSVAIAAKKEGLTMSPDPQPEEAVFTRSDHYPLVRAGVPAVFLKTGWKDAKGGLACKDAERTFRLNSYHELSDQIDLPFDWSAAAKFARLNTGIIRSIADAPQAPRWYAGDYFGDSFAPEAQKAVKAAP
jgi:hypothetical protein